MDVVFFSESLLKRLFIRVQFFSLLFLLVLSVRRCAFLFVLVLFRRRGGGGVGFK